MSLVSWNEISVILFLGETSRISRPIVVLGWRGDCRIRSSRYIEEGSNRYKFGFFDGLGSSAKHVAMHGRQWMLIVLSIKRAQRVLQKVLETLHRSDLQTQASSWWSAWAEYSLLRGETWSGQRPDCTLWLCARPTREAEQRDRHDSRSRCDWDSRNWTGWDRCCALYIPSLPQEWKKDPLHKTCPPPHPPPKMNESDERAHAGDASSSTPGWSRIETGSCSHSPRRECCPLPRWLPCQTFDT